MPPPPDDGRQIGKSAAADAVVADLPVGVADLQHGEPRQVLLDELLVRDDPSRGDCREESEPVFGFEVFGSRVSEVELQQVAVVVSVGHAPREGHVALGNGLEYLVGGRCVADRGHFRVGLHVVEEQSADAVFAERAVVAELELSVGAPPARGRGRLVQRLLVEYPGRDQVSVHVPHAFGLVEGRSFQPVGALVVEPVVGEASRELEAFGDETEILLDPDVRLHLVFPVGLVSRVVEQDVGRDLVVVRSVGRELSVRVAQRHGDRGHAADRLPEVVVYGQARIALVGDPPADTDLEDRAFGDVHVGVEPVVVAVVARAASVLLLQVVVVDAVLLVVGSRDVVAGRRSAAAQVEHGLERRGVVLEQEFLPIDIGVEVRVEAVLDDLQLVVAVYGVLVAGHAGFICQGRIGPGIDEFAFEGRGRDAVFGLEIDVHLALLAPLGGDQYDAVGSALSVDRRGRGVLQHGERFDVLDVDFVEVTLDSIDQNEGRRVGSEGRYAADPEFRGVFSGLSRPLYGDDSRDIPGQRVGDVCRRDLQVLHLHRGDGPDDRGPLLVAGSDHHHLLHGVGVLRHLYVDRALAHDRNLLGGITQVTEHECFVRSGPDPVISVDVGVCAQSGLVLDNDIDADQRQSVRIDDFPLYDVRVRFLVSLRAGRVGAPRPGQDEKDENE